MNTLTANKICFECNQECIPEANSMGTGYGLNENDQPICYACCALIDIKRMSEDGKAVLYLQEIEGAREFNAKKLGNAWLKATHKITNWPGTLEIPIYKVKVGNHNMAGKRYDFWFVFKDQTWHGTQYGDNTQIAHCKRVKK